MSEEKKKLFGIRISEYFKNFPESKVLRKANVDVNNGPEALLNSIREVTGVTDELVAQWEKNKRSIRNGSLPVPFAMLDLFLSNTNDIYTSWMLAKNTPEEELEFKINQAAQSSQERFDALLEKGNSIFIEETTLILMHELSVLDLFLGSVSEFIILNSCFEKMNSLGFSVLHGIVNHLPQGILNTITKHRAKLIIEQDNKENRLESYRKAISKNEGGYIFLTDDANTLMLCGSGVNTLIHGNVYNVLLNLNRNNHIQDKELFELIAKVSTYGFKSINMETDLMARVFCHFLSENKDYTKTAFKSIFDKVFSSRFKFNEVVGVLYRFLNFIIDEGKIKINAGIILSLFTNFLLRHPHDNKIDFILKWFLFQCVNGKEHYVSTLLPMSVAHATLWSSCHEMCCIAMDREISSNEIFTKVCSYILEQKENNREHIYNSVTKCFIPGTADYESFSRIYKELSLIINVRNN